MGDLWLRDEKVKVIPILEYIYIAFVSHMMVADCSVPQMSNARMKHILHGDAGGGLHHASGLVNDPTKKVLEVIEPNRKGVYKVRYELPDGSTKLSTMFPDSKSEIQVAKSIENVFSNSKGTINDVVEGSGRKLTGTDATGIPVEIITDQNYNIITAYPLFQ